MKQYTVIYRRKHGTVWAIALQYMDTEQAMTVEMKDLQSEEPYRVYAVVPVEVPDVVEL